MSAPRGWALVGRYGAFAVVATLVNLGLQRLVLAALGTTVVQYLIALVLGTGAGLVVMACGGETPAAVGSPVTRGVERR